MKYQDLVTKGPEWKVDWDSISQFPWVQAMKGCQQNPEYHAEGDVYIHQRMVSEALAALPDYRALNDEDRETVFWAALLHDVAKPFVTKFVNGNWTSRGHSKAGSIEARRILWEMGMPFYQRECVCNMVRYHQMPFFLMADDNDYKPKLIEIAVTCGMRLDLLAILAKADLIGRTSDEALKAQTMDNIELFSMASNELEETFKFPDHYTQFLYFQGKWQTPEISAYNPTEFEVVLMSGLPYMGKDFQIQNYGYTCIQNNPIISLDAIREELKIKPTDNQGHVIQTAKDRAKEFLRKKQSFVWNSTNLTISQRSKMVRLFTDYGAYVRIMYVESTYEQWLANRKKRERYIGGEILTKMQRKWEVPDPFEAHHVFYSLRN